MARRSVPIRLGGPPTAATGPVAWRRSSGSDASTCSATSATCWPPTRGNTNPDPGGPPGRPRCSPGARPRNWPATASWPRKTTWTKTPGRPRPSATASRRNWRGSGTPPSWTRTGSGLHPHPHRRRLGHRAEEVMGRQRRIAAPQGPSIPKLTPEEAGPFGGTAGRARAGRKGAGHTSSGAARRARSSMPRQM